MLRGRYTLLPEAVDNGMMQFVNINHRIRGGYHEG